MLISELVNTLVGMRQEYGDLEVMLPQCGDEEDDGTCIRWLAHISIIETEKDKNDQLVIAVY